MKRVLKFVSPCIKSTLLKSSAVMVLGSLIASFINYLTNTFVGRILGPEEYGIFISLTSLLMIFSVSNGTISTVVMKYVATFKAQGKLSSVEFLWEQLTKLFLAVGGVAFTVVVLASPFITRFLKIGSSIPVIILGGVLGVSLIATASLATLAGLQEFSKYQIFQIIGALVKLFVSVGLVYWGFKTEGALTGFVVAIVIPFLFSAFYIKKISNVASKKVSIPLKEPFFYFLPVTLATLGLTLLFNLDVTLVKKFLSPSSAGLYGGLSVIGRVVLFGTNAVTLVMFPLVSERLAQRMPFQKILFLSAGLTALGGVVITTFYFLFPRFTIAVFLGSRFYEGTHLVGWFGLFLTFYSLCNLLVQFLLAVEFRKVWVLTIAASIIQTLGIVLYHVDITQVLIVNFISIGTLLLSLIVVTTVVIQRK